MEEVIVIVKAKLREIKGKYYAQLSWKLNGHHSTCLATGVRVDGLVADMDNTKLTAAKRKKLKEQAYNAAILEMGSLRERKIVELEHQMALYFKECALVWLDACEKKNLRATTLAVYKDIVNGKLIPKFGDRKVSDITKKDIEDYYAELRLAGLSKNSIKHYNSYLSGIFKTAKKKGYIRDVPTSDISFRNAYTYRGKSFTKDQIAAIKQAVEGTLLELPVYLALYCGLRRSETLGLLWTNVDLVNDMLNVVTTKNSVSAEIEYNTKSRSSKRTLPIPPALKQVLLKAKSEQDKNREYMGNRYGLGCKHDFVVTNEDGSPLSCDAVSKGFKKILDTLGYVGYNFHSLRHTYGTYMGAGSVGAFVIQGMMGHSSVTTTDIYVHPDYKAKQDAAKILAQMYGDTEE